MDFTLDTEQAALRDAVREMVGRFEITDPIGLAPLASDHWSALAEMGVVAEAEIGPLEEMVIAQELGRARVRVPYAETVLASAVLRQHGHEDLLGALGAGEALVVPALTEPGRAWGAPATASVDSDRVSGTWGPVPWLAAASHLILATPDGPVLVAAPEVREGTVVSLDDVEATWLREHDLDGPLARATVALCAEALGAMESALSLTTEYLKTRKQFGVPLMSFQTLTQRAADLYVQVELARSMVAYAAMTLADADADAPEQREVASRAKAVVGKAARLVGQEAIQLHGGIGMTAEYPVGHLTARLTAIEHTWGDTRHHLSVLGPSGHGTVDVI